MRHILHTQVETLELILASWQHALGDDFDAYRNHCYRVLNVTLALAPDQPDGLEKTAVAVAFHDLAIWARKTFDYIEPSVEMAQAWLQEHDRSVWADEVCAMISQHHKVTAWPDQSATLVESFRQADWCDVSLGLLRFRLDKSFLPVLKQQFPNTGFHRRLIQLSARQLMRHPLKPLPMMRW